MPVFHHYHALLDASITSGCYGFADHCMVFIGIDILCVYGVAVWIGIWIIHIPES